MHVKNWKELISKNIFFRNLYVPKKSCQISFLKFLEMLACEFLAHVDCFIACKSLSLIVCKFETFLAFLKKFDTEFACAQLISFTLLACMYIRIVAMNHTCSLEISDLLDLYMPLSRTILVDHAT